MFFLQSAATQDDLQFSYKVGPNKSELDNQKDFFFHANWQASDTIIASKLSLNTSIEANTRVYRRRENKDVIRLGIAYVTDYSSRGHRFYLSLFVSEPLPPIEDNQDKSDGRHNTKFKYGYGQAKKNAEQKIISEGFYTIALEAPRLLTAKEKLSLHKAVLKKLKNADKEIQPKLKPCGYGYCGEIQINGYTTQIVLEVD